MNMTEEEKKRLVEKYKYYGVLLAGKLYPPNQLPREFHKYVTIDISMYDLEDFENLVDEINAYAIEKLGDDFRPNSDYTSFTDLGDILDCVFSLGIQKVLDEEMFADEDSPLRELFKLQKSYIDRIADDELIAHNPSSDFLVGGSRHLLGSENGFRLS